MISDFIVADPLHLLELGVMKRLMIGWKSGNMACPRWTEMNKLLSGINTPHEIHRGARSLNLFRLWKDQEFRNFMNYFGVLVLRLYLPRRYYAHFLVLFCNYSRRNGSVTTISETNDGEISFIQCSSAHSRSSLQNVY